MRDDMRAKSWRYRELHVMFVNVRAVSRYQYVRLVGYSHSRTWAASREDGVPRPNSFQRQANPKVSLIQYVVLESSCYDIHLFSNFLIWFSRTVRFLLGLETDVPHAAHALGTEREEEGCSHPGVPSINFDGVPTKFSDVIEGFDYSELEVENRCEVHASSQ